MEVLRFRHRTPVQFPALRNAAGSSDCAAHTLEEQSFSFQETPALRKTFYTHKAPQDSGLPDDSPSSRCFADCEALDVGSCLSSEFSPSASVTAVPSTDGALPARSREGTARGAADS